ncbi:FxSxx-COOH system tetratricopeptide repeat protein [Actinomadura litoris]|uniref:FxSxx-COOH system tetratricopeptide repeat protein n=1 Tax=Actinomadura litoris TaxID=2678616 RepID=UPI001FA7E03A|nr:FxSxx-COOH system tetratricopeptide repeat protein [Actinomadura litoris]
MWLLDVASAALVVAGGVAVNQILNDGRWAWWWLVIALVLAVTAAVITHRAAATPSGAGAPPNPVGTRNQFVGGRASQVVQLRDGTVHQTFQETVRAPGALPPVVGVDGTGLVGLPRRPAPVFVDRQDALMSLRRTLATGEAGVIAQSVVGLGGVGKSELALQYAHQQRGEYRLVWWLLAETREDIEAGLAGLGQALAAPVAPTAAARTPAPEAAAWALAWLAVHDRWLLVFDNAEHPDDLQTYLGRLGSGHVLITSRRATGWPVTGATVLRLPVLSQDAAADLLARTLDEPDAPPADDGEVLHELAAELGGLPLALRQTAAYIAATPGMNGVEYLRRLRSSPRWALAATPTQATGSGPGSANRSGRSDEQVVSATWQVTMDRIGHDHPLAPRVMRLMACFAPDNLPVDVLYRLPGHSSDVADQVQVEQALAALLVYSMIDQAPGRRHLSVHRLVQAVTRAQLSQAERDEDQATAAALLTQALPDTPRTLTSWPAFAELLPHALHLLPPDSPPMSTVLDYLDASGDYRAARDLGRARATALHHRHSPHHPATLDARHDHAHWTGKAGDPTGARDLFAELLPIRERVLGPEHPDTLTSRHNFARWTGASGDPSAARDLFAELLPIRERVQGPHHPGTLSTRHNFARWTGLAGDPVAARDLFADLLPIRERVQGPHHPGTLTTRHTLAHWTGEAGDPVAARDLYADLLPIRERVLGPGHPDTLTTRNNLAYWNRRARFPRRTRRARRPK